MLKIKEVIIVEGKDDINAVKRAVDAEIITTNGMGLTEETLKEIEAISNRSEIIIFTDPDYPGEKIRSLVSRRVSNCKQAYLSQDKAKCKTTGKIGIEYASPEDIREALLNAKAQKRNSRNIYDTQDLLRWQLAGSPLAGKRRTKMGEILGIGKTNAKQFLSRLNSFKISREEIETALIEIEGLES